MNRPFASPLTRALSPGGGEGDPGRAHDWFMGTGHVSRTWKLSTQYTARHRRNDFIFFLTLERRPTAVEHENADKQPVAF